MTRNSRTLILMAMAAGLATAAWAQFGDGAPMPPAGFGNGTPMPTAGGRPGMMRRLPFAAGTVSAVDGAAGTVTLTPLFGQSQSQTVKVTATTTITAQTSAKVTDLKIGETILVRGVPTGITVSQITDSDSRESQPGGPLEERVSNLGGTLGGTLGQQPNGGRGPWLGAAPAIAQATGKITSLSPLTLSLSPDVLVILKAAPDVKVTQTTTEKIGDLKIGDRVMAEGQSADDGTLTADRIRVNGYGHSSH